MPTLTVLPLALAFATAPGAAFDYNRGAGYPVHGYIQQLVDLASELKAIAPLAMAGGFNLQVPHAITFHTLSWPLGSSDADWSYDGRFGAGNWEWSPMHLYAVHDRVILNFHNLGDSVDDERRLAFAIAHGYAMMSAVAHGRCDTLGDDEPAMRWLWWLDAVQKNLCSRYLGKELLDFRYIGPGVVAARYPDLQIVVNLADRPCDGADGRTTLAPFGWYATSDDGALKAGHVTRFHDRPWPLPVGFVRLAHDGEVDLWLHARRECEIEIPDAGGTMRVVRVGGATQRQAIRLGQGAGRPARAVPGHDGRAWPRHGGRARSTIRCPAPLNRPVRNKGDILLFRLRKSRMSPFPAEIADGQRRHRRTEQETRDGHIGSCQDGCRGDGCHVPALR